MSHLRKDVGSRIRAMRRKSGMTQEALADRCGLHWTYIGGLERGERNPTLSTLEKIASGLSVSVYDLISGRRMAVTMTARERKEGRMIRMLRRREESVLDLAATVVRDLCHWTKKHEKGKAAK